MQPTNGLTGTYPGAEYTPDEIEFMLAVDAYKRRRQRPYPTWTEILEVARSLGYRKVAEPGPLPLYPPRRECP